MLSVTALLTVRFRKHTVWVFARIRSWFDGAGWFVAGAGALLFVALLVALLELQSQSALLWTGQAVAGSERGGIGHYTWHGQPYTVDVQGSSATAPSVTFYVDPGNPSTAIPDSIGTRVANALGVGVPVLAGVVVLVIGGTRNYRWKRRNEKRGETDWWLSKVPRSGR